MKILDEIIAQEWEAFQNVRNTGGRADCQNDQSAFTTNRKSQFMAWSPEARQSYYNDLKAAQAAGRNLVMEKYARMMAWTHPAEYRRIEEALPDISSTAQALVEKIASIQLPWQHEFAKIYPRLAARGRVIDSSGAPFEGASFEVYMRGELLTYSEETLRVYLAHLERLQCEGKNISLLVTENLVRLYGYNSLSDAEAQA